MSGSSELRRLLASGQIIRAPGVFDGITAKLVEQAGFPAVYMTGAGSSMSLGYPDIGLLSLTEMVDKARIITRTVAVPTIADADTGYGNEINVTRAVQEYERAGVAAMHLEDQVSPKRCGHVEGKELVQRDEFVAKIRAAVAARRDPDLVIIARTDARAVTGFDDAIDRANAAIDAGADIAFVEAIPTLQELAAVPRLVHGPCLLNIVRGGKTPDLSLGEAEAMGYRIAILPSLLIAAVMDVCDRTLLALKESDCPPPAREGPSVSERFRRFGFDEWASLPARFRKSG